MSKRVVQHNPALIRRQLQRVRCWALGFIALGLLIAWLAPPAGGKVFVGLATMAALLPVYFLPLILFHVDPRKPLLREDFIFLALLHAALLVMVFVAGNGAFSPRLSGNLPESLVTGIVMATGYLFIAGVFTGFCVPIMDFVANHWRRFPADHECAVCGYDLRGCVNGICPECGQAMTAVITCAWCGAMQWQRPAGRCVRCDQPMPRGGPDQSSPSL